jgi:hypothetical protein
MRGGAQPIEGQGSVSETSQFVTMSKLGSMSLSSLQTHQRGRHRFSASSPNIADMALQDDALKQGAAEARARRLAALAGAGGPHRACLRSLRRQAYWRLVIRHPGGGVGPVARICCIRLQALPAAALSCSAQLSNACLPLCGGWESLLLTMYDGLDAPQLRRQRAAAPKAAPMPAAGSPSPDGPGLCSGSTCPPLSRRSISSLGLAFEALPDPAPVFRPLSRPLPPPRPPPLLERCMRCMSLSP